MLKKLRSSLACMAVALAAACDGRVNSEYSPAFSRASVAETERRYTFGVYPAHKPQHLAVIYGPLVEELDARVPGAQFKLIASRDYEAFEERLVSGELDFALANPYEALLAVEHGYGIFGKMADDDQFRGIILVRKDSGVRTPADLKGRAISYPAPTALAATMMPQHYLQTHGLDVMKETETRYVGSHESSILNVYHGMTQAGATWPPPWELYAAAHPEVAAALEVKWSTAPLVNNALVAHGSVPVEVRRQVADVLTSLHSSEQGRRILAQIPVSRFVTADRRTYAAAETFLGEFEQSVRKVR